MLLQIPNPCNENWAEMTPEVQGRFCQVCQKTVVDFTEMTDNQVIRFFKENENICGRFNPQQINQSLSESIEIIRPNRHPAWKYMIWSALAVGSLLITNDLYAQGSPIQKQTENPQVVVGKPISLSNKIGLKGIIFDASTETEISNATISVKGSHISTISDANGHFEIKLPENWATQKIELVINAHGYVSENQMVNPKQFGNIIIINMRKSAKEPVQPIVKPPVLMGKVAPYPRE